MQARSIDQTSGCEDRVVERFSAEVQLRKRVHPWSPLRTRADQRLQVLTRTGCYIAEYLSCIAPCFDLIAFSGVAPDWSW